MRVPRAFFISVLAIAMWGITTDAQAYRLRMNGLVTDYSSEHPLAQARVRIYKDGVLQKEQRSNAMGRYSFLFDNHGNYVVRVDAPGYQGKCITISTHGLEWERDGRVSDLDVEMRLLAKRPDVDLSFQDLPLGIAFFEPATGHTRWSRAYERNIMADSHALMLQYEQQEAALQPVAHRRVPIDPGFLIRL